MQRLRADERGQILPLFVVGLLTLLMFVAVSINVGQAVVRRQQVQMVADYGALTGAAVQARGLNQMARINQLSLRIFNTFSMRARLTGFVNWYFPGNNMGPIKWIFDALSALGIDLGSEIPVEEPDIMERYYNFFLGTRYLTRFLNYGYQVQALIEAAVVTERNIQALFGDDVVRQLRDEYTQYGALPYRPVVSLNLTDVAAGFGQQLADGVNSVLSQFTNPEKLRDLLLVAICAPGADKKKCGARAVRDKILGAFLGGKPGERNRFDPTTFANALFTPVVPRWAGCGDITSNGRLNLIRECGDDLIVRYWTDYPPAFKKTVEWIARIATILPPPAGCLGCGGTYVREAFRVNNLFRFVTANNWHEMPVTLSRLGSGEAQTVFTWWVRVPTASTTIGSWMFADLPSMTAFAAAKPIGGHLGVEDPEPVPLWGALLPFEIPGFVRWAFSKFDLLFQPNQKLERGGEDGNQGVPNQEGLQFSGLNDIRRQRARLRARHDLGLITDQELADGLADLRRTEAQLQNATTTGGAATRRSYSYTTERPGGKINSLGQAIGSDTIPMFFHWYVLQQRRRYEPRLVPIRGRYLIGTGFRNLACSKVPVRFIGGEREVPVMRWSGLRDMLIKNAPNAGALTDDVIFWESMLRGTYDLPEAAEQALNFLECTQLEVGLSGLGLQSPFGSLTQGF